MLGSTYVKIIYEVEVEDDTEAKSVEVNMKANEFKEILNANIKAQSPTLKATVETLEQPVTRRKKLLRKQRMAIISLTLKTRKAMVQRGEGYGIGPS